MVFVSAIGLTLAWGFHLEWWTIELLETLFSIRPSQPIGGIRFQKPLEQPIIWLAYFFTAQTLITAAVSLLQICQRRVASET
jgi:hypothetical protein